MPTMLSDIALNCGQSSLQLEISPCDEKQPNMAEYDLAVKKSSKEVLLSNHLNDKELSM